jgi:hypothetical protein
LLPARASNFPRETPRTPFELLLTGLVLDRFSLGGEHAPEQSTGDAGDAQADGHAHTHERYDATHGSVLEPHTNHELLARAMASILVERTFASLGAEAVFVFAGEGAGPWVARAEVGHRFSRHLRLAAGVDVPFAGERRFNWRGRVGLVWLF